MQNPRYNPKPPKVQLRTGKSAPARDIDALRIIHYNYCMSADLLCKYVGWSYIYGKDRIRHLKSHKLIAPQQYARDPWKCDFLFLTEQGRKYLHDRGLYIEALDRLKANTREEMAHTIMISDFLALMHIELRASNLGFIHEHEIIDLTKNVTKTSNPRMIESDPKINPDRYFGIQYGHKAVLFNVEIETGTHRGKQRSRKVNNTQLMYQQRAWERKLTVRGTPFPNLMTAFVASSERHMQLLMQEARKSRPTDPLIFNWIPCVADGERPEANGRLIQPWYMADGSRFDILTGQKIKA